MERAQVIFETEDRASLVAKLKRLDPGTLPSFNRDKKDHLAIVIAKSMLKVTGGDVVSCSSTARDVSWLLDRMQAKHGCSPTVRIRHDLMWDCIDGSLNYRLFSVLCSVYAVIGSKKYPVGITRQRIIAGALGYKSPKLMTEEELKSRTDGAVPLTVKQVRQALDELERRSLITRVQASRRKVFFSNRMTREQMRKEIISATVRRRVKLKKYRQDDREIQSRVDAAVHAVLFDPRSQGQGRDSRQP